MNPVELIALARALVNGVIAGSDSATQTELRRAVSCAYYAMFHTLSVSNANSLVGTSTADQQRWSWRQIYRAADHRPARNKLTSASLGNRFPREIRRFGAVFAEIQSQRHSADYDPHSDFSATGMSDLIDRVEIAISTFNQTPDDIRRDLAVHILTNIRTD